MIYSADNLIGRRLGSYEIVEPIGQGGMARVYKGYHEELDRYAAIKVIIWGFSEDQDYTVRFRREARAIASLRHPHIVTIYDFGKFDQGYYLVMEYIEGEDLEAAIGRGEPLSANIIQTIIADIASALDYTHQHHVIHRDVKPSNIMISSQGEAILTDFGLVMLPNAMGNTTLGTSFGTPYYMAPEQAASSAAAVPASDIYSLGVILFELITGTPPYVADTPLGVALKHVSDPIPNIQDFVPDVPNAVKAVVEQAMAKEVSDRFRTASEMSTALIQAWREKPSSQIQMESSAESMVASIVPPPLPVTPLAPAPISTIEARPPIPAGRSAMRAAISTPNRQMWPQLAGGVLIILLLIALSIGVGINLGRANSPVQADELLANEGQGSSIPVSPSEGNENGDLALAAQTSNNGDGSQSQSDNTPPLSTFNPTQTSTATALPTVSPTLTPTETSLPTETPIPTPTQPPVVALEPTDTPAAEDLLADLRGKILFKTDRAGRVEIYQMNPDGSDQKPLGADLAFLYNEAIRWETFSANRQETIVVRGEGQVDLWHVNMAEGVELRVTTEGAADYDPVWSPIENDNRIVFVSERTGRGDLYLLDLDGSGVRRLTHNENDFDKHPSWAPNGTQVVYWSDQGWQKKPQIWLLSLEDGAENLPISLSNNPFRDWDPVWVK